MAIKAMSGGGAATKENRLNVTPKVGTGVGGNEAGYNYLTGGNQSITNNGPVSGSGGGYGSGYGTGSGGYSGSNTMSDYLAALRAERDAAIAEANGLLDEQGRLAEKRYALQKEASDQDYQDLKNQSEVNRYKSKGTLRQSLADRGALDSGIGRQAYLSLSNNFNNALNRISLQQKREDAERNQAINEMWNQIAMSKAANKMAGLDMMGNLLSQFDPSMLMSGVSTGGYSYDPATSSYYQAAQNAAQNTPYISGGSAMGNGQYTTGATSAGRAAAFDDILAELKRRQSGFYGR